MGVAILGTGSYLPERVVTNDEAGARAGVDDAWVRMKTAIKTRHYVAEDEATSDLAIHAGRKALEASGLAADQLDWVIVATSTPDHPQPATASFVQAALGAENAAAFDVNSVCSGFLTALTTARSLVANGGHALVIGADVYSRILDARDRRTVILFGDGAGAAVVGPGHADHGIIATSVHTYGTLTDKIIVPAGGSRLPVEPHHRESGEAFFQMQGRDVREFVVEQVPGLVETFLHENGCPPEMVDHLVLHQANGVMIRELADKLALPHAQHHLTVEDAGNTGSASCAITLDHAVRAGEIHDGDLVLMVAFGGGMTAALTLLRW